MNKQFGILLITLLLFSCKKETQEELPVVSDYSHGRFVTNEGNFGSNNASITYISNDNVVIQDVYYTQNQVELGDILQSFCIIGQRGYAVLNNSLKIEIVQMNDMKNVGTIGGFTYPRYMIDGKNGAAYVTDGSFAGQVHVIDLSSNTITASIPVGSGPENLAANDHYLFVCNSGGWSIDQTVSVIDLATNSIVQTITTADRPTDLVIDQNGDCWVLCAGETIYDGDWNITGHTDAMIYKIDGSTFAVEDAQIIGINGDHPRLMDISPDGQTIYFENNGVYSFEITDSNFGGSQLISGSMNSLNVDPTNGHIWCAGPTNFMDPSEIFQYDANGNLINTFEGSIGSNGCSFN